MPAAAMRTTRWSLGLVLLALVGVGWAPGDHPPASVAPQPPTLPSPDPGGGQGGGVGGRYRGGIPPVELTAKEDHQRIMDLLKITSLRKGADGRNAKAANAANYDESKANPYPKLPDPLVLKDGQ